MVFAKLGMDKVMGHPRGLALSSSVGERMPRNVWR